MMMPAYETGHEPLPYTESAGALIWNFPTYKHVSINFRYLYPTLFMVLCYSSPKKKKNRRVVLKMWTWFRISRFKASSGAFNNFLDNLRDFCLHALEDTVSKTLYDKVKLIISLNLREKIKCSLWGIVSKTEPLKALVIVNNQKVASQESRAGVATHTQDQTGQEDFRSLLLHWIKKWMVK